MSEVWPDMEITYALSNGELAAAIDRTREMIGGTAEDCPTYPALVEHFKALLDIQRIRAGLVHSAITDKEDTR